MVALGRLAIRLRLPAVPGPLMRAYFDSESVVYREVRLAGQMIERFALDLSGLCVLTEAANGAYRYNPALTALAGAEVIAIARDNRYASAAEARDQVERFARFAGVAGRIRVVGEATACDWERADIVTNTGAVRPIDSDVVARLKPTAVVPLMWETWEYRPGEVDLRACHERGVLCLGTDESAPPLTMDPYVTMLALHQLFRLGLEGYGNRVVIIGSDRFPRRAYDGLRNVGVETIWFSPREADWAARQPGEAVFALERLPQWWETHGTGVDAVLVAELTSDRVLIGHRAILDTERVAVLNPAVRVGVLAGVVDVPGLTAHGIAVTPERLAPPGYMSAQLYDLGPAPVMALFAAGLKVGEWMARARLAGLGPQDAARRVLANPLAMDFTGEFAWVRAGGDTAGLAT